MRTRYRSLLENALSSRTLLTPPVSTTEDIPAFELFSSPQKYSSSTPSIYGTLPPIPTTTDINQLIELHDQSVIERHMSTLELFPNKQVHYNPSSTFLTQELLDALMSTKSEMEFLKIIPRSVLGFCELSTLRKASQHLLDREIRPPSRRKPMSTVAIMCARKMARNCVSARKSKRKKNISTNISSIHEMIIILRMHPNLMEQLSEDTREFISTFEPDKHANLYV